MRVRHHHWAMRPILWLPFSCAVLFTLSGCANMSDSAGSSPTGTGPFDSQGNYHEEWANDPSKWRKTSSHSQASSDELPVVAKNEQPPPNASPFTAPEAAAPKSSATRKSSASRASAHHADESKPATSKTKAAAGKSSTHKSAAPVDEDAPKPKASAHKTTAKTTAKTTVHDDADTPQTTLKAAAKASAKGSRYTVKKGDTLISIAEHNHSSAAEIRKANGLSGKGLKPGKTLVIPK